MIGVCERCRGTRKVVVSGVKNGKHYKKKLACPLCTKPREAPRGGSA